MELTSFASQTCPVARALEQVGPWWDLLLVRNVFLGMRRFGQLQAQLGIVPTTLNRRLAQLCNDGILERKRYHAHPPRYEYHLTDKGNDLLPVLVSLLAWGNKWLAPEGRAVMLRDRDTGAEVEPAMVDSGSGRQLTRRSLVLSAGPAADRSLRQLLDAHGAVSATETAAPVQIEQKQRGVV